MPGHKGNNHHPEHHHKPVLNDFATMRDLSVAIVLVGHDYYRDLGLQEILGTCKNPSIVMDIPNMFVHERHNHKDIVYWNL